MELKETQAGIARCYSSRKSALRLNMKLVVEQQCVPEGRGHLFRSCLPSRDERIEIHNDPRSTKQAAAANQKNESQGSRPKQTDGLHQQADNEQHARKAQSSFESTYRRFHLAPFQNFTLLSCPTLCTTSWQPLETHEILLAFTAGSRSGSAVCTAPSSNDRAPRWQCRHSRLCRVRRDEWDCEAYQNTARIHGATR